MVPQTTPECADRYEITLIASDGSRFLIPKYVMKNICTYMNIAKMEPYDYIFAKPRELRDNLAYSNFELDKLVDVKVIDKRSELDRPLQRFVDRSVQKYMSKQNSGRPNLRKKPPESKGHALVKNEIVEFLRSLAMEAYPEVVFYDGKVYGDFYEWQRNERRKNPDADGVFGYGSVGFGNYKPEYGGQIKCDVAGWVGNSLNFIYPIVSVEVMKSSNLREEVVNLNKIHGLYSVFTVIVDALGGLTGMVNNTPIVSLEGFKKGMPKRIRLAREAISAGKNEHEIFEIGRRFNVGSLE